MAGFTTADLTTIQNAIMALSTGAEQVQINGRMYRKTSLAELRNTYDWLKKNLATAGASSIIRGTFGAVTDQDGDRG